ncbi:MAG: Endonuclease/exonuclease/phosphatase [Pedosphaera sp.]|nr:Endonuclease/exonuclease/phosphatase [Pedosphaera sp.]
MKKFASTLLAVSCLSVIPVGAQTITQWTFESSVPAGTGAAIGSIAAENGVGTASGLHASAATTYSSPAGNGSTHSFSANTWATGDYFQFQSSTVGFSNISLSFDQTSSGTGPKFFDLAYSTDGSTFTTFVSQNTVLANSSPNAWSVGTAVPAANFYYDLSSVAALNNASSVYFRLIENSGTTSASGGVLGTGGTDRVDNFTLAVVPEPSTFALIGLGGAGLLAFRRRKN